MSRASRAQRIPSSQRKKPQDGASSAWPSHMPIPEPTTWDRVMLCSDWPGRTQVPQWRGVARPHPHPRGQACGFRLLESLKPPEQRPAARVLYHVDSMFQFIFSAGTPRGLLFAVT